MIKCDYTEPTAVVSQSVSQSVGRRETQELLVNVTAHIVEDDDDDYCNDGEMLEYNYRLLK